MIAKDELERLRSACDRMRYNILTLAHQADKNGAHIGPALSIVEIMSVLYLSVMNINKYNIDNVGRDRFILSKGHGALGYYVALYEAGIITKDELYTYEINGSSLPGQPSKKQELGIEYSGGSLGLGLSYGCGIALAAKRKNLDFPIYILVGDGELNEGSVWESAMFAKHNKLSNITVIIDRNSMQSDGLSKDILEIDVEAIWKGFGWKTVSCDGHNIEQLLEAFSINASTEPKVIIADTIKGKGISFMENSREWHHNRLTDEVYQEALTNLKKTGCIHDGI